jgi:hypothetical protein
MSENTIVDGSAPAPDAPSGPVIATVDMPRETPAHDSSASPRDLDLPVGHEDQPQATAFLDNVEPAEPTIKAPHGYTKAEKELFATLSPEQQARLAEAETRRTRDVYTRIAEAQEAEKRAAAEQHQAALAAQQAQLERAQFSDALHALLSSVDQTWGDLAKIDPSAWQQFAEQNPSRAADVARLQGFLHSFREQNAQVRAEYQQRIQVAQEQQRQAQIQWAAAQDEQFRARVPESADPVKWGELQRQAAETLTHHGFSPDEIRNAWEVTGFARDHRAQALIRDATYWRLAQARVREARPVQPRRPLSPGTSSYGRDSGGSDLQKLADRGDMAAYIRARERGNSRQR